jgi:tetratricopeptide (TPR) repeat protein
MAATLAEVFNMLDRIHDVLPLYERAWQFAQSKGLLLSGQWVLAFMGDAYGRAGQIDKAIATERQALELSRQLGQPACEARALYLLGSIYGYGASPRRSEARESFQKALTLTHELKMRPLEAQCQFALGELASKEGRKDEAQQLLTFAVAMFREMGMQSWLEKAESALNLSAQ